MIQEEELDKSGHGEVKREQNTPADQDQKECPLADSQMLRKQMGKIIICSDIILSTSSNTVGWHVKFQVNDKIINLENSYMGTFLLQTFLEKNVRQEGPFFFILFSYIHDFILHLLCPRQKYI